MAGPLLLLCDTLTFLSGRGGPAWSLVLGNAGNEMTHPPVEEHVGREASLHYSPLIPQLVILYLHHHLLFPLNFFVWCWSLSVRKCSTLSHSLCSPSHFLETVSYYIALVGLKLPM